MPKGTVVELPGEILVSIQGPIYQQGYWLRGKFYELEMLRYIRKHYQGGTFIDGGACIGNHTLWFARFCADQVIAVEPVERNMKHLMQNVEMSGLLDKVTPAQFALGKQSGRGSMVNTGSYHGTYELKKGKGVEVVTLNQIGELAEHPITLIKLDIQGSELNALKGGAKLLTEYGPVLFIEVRHNKRNLLGPITEFLRPLGYVRGQRFNKTPTYRFFKPRGDV